MLGVVGGDGEADLFPYLKSTAGLRRGREKLKDRGGYERGTRKGGSEVRKREKEGGGRSTVVVQRRGEEGGNERGKEKGGKEGMERGDREDDKKVVRWRARKEKAAKDTGGGRERVAGGGRASTVSSMMLGGLKGYSAGSRIRP